jgi:glycosyltransferase involved in cell wall biosynthesis
MAERAAVHAGDASDLGAKVRWLCERPEVAAAMGREARVVYEARYTPERNLARLLEIYGEALEASRPATR